MRKTAQLALLLHRRPSELLGVKDKSSVWLLEFDYQLLQREAESLQQEENREEKIEKIREWKRRRSI
jgi:hypothetical protein